MNEAHVLIVVAYAVLMIFVGMYPSSKISGKDAFLISNRSLHGASSGFTIAASKIGGGLLVTYSTLFFVFGVQAFWLFVGYIIGYFIFYLFARKIHKESKKNNYYTMADYFRDKYGSSAGITVGVLCTISIGGWILTNLIAGGMLLSSISGWSSLFTTTTLAIVIASYLVAGGFNAVVRTDVIQFFSLIIIGIIIAIALYQSNGAVTKEAIPVLGENSLPIGQIISFILIGIIFPMGSAELWQRVYAADTEKDYFRATIIASVSFALIGIVLSFVCYKLMMIGGMSHLPEELRLVSGVANLVNDIHPLLSTLWFLAFAAAILSSADTFIYTTASSAVQDIFLRTNLINKTDVVQWIRYTIVILALLGVIGSVVFKDIVSVTFYFLGLSLVLGVAGYISMLNKNIKGITLIIPIVLAFVVSSVYSFMNGISITTSIVALGTTVVVFIFELVVIYIGRFFNKQRGS